MKIASKYIRFGFSVALVLTLLSVIACDQRKEQARLSAVHPSLTLTAGSIAEMKSSLGRAPLFDQTLARTIEEVDALLYKPIAVPVPKDMAGGYTHETHKGNFFVMQKAGALYQITSDEKYANYVKQMLLAYAKLYPTLDLHPADRSYAPGRLFWQCLNDANWLVYTSQAYDCIYDFLSAKEHELLERDLFRPYAEFLSTSNPRFFNSIHNHSTWAVAGVGMIGLVMQDEELLNRALYGMEGHRQNADRAGFLAQIDLLFSPDGFYAEGPYYHRYAISPFVLFAQSLANCRPDLKIFEYRQGLLRKSLYTLLNLTDADGEFFPINDAQKGMSFHSRELIAAVDVIYALAGNDPQLLSIASLQNTVTLDNAGLSVARALKGGLQQDFDKRSMELRDGVDGHGGGLGILRSKAKEDEITLVMKYTGQGMGHGHFDKLSFSMYENGDEVIQDYGMARFVNIEQKAGGAYLPENNLFAKQTVAHNTIVIDETTNFNGNVELANQHHSEAFLFEAGNDSLQLMIARDTTGYAGMKLQRTMAIIKDEAFEKPLVVDFVSARPESKARHTYDLPYYYLGQLISTTWSYVTEKTLKPLSTANGYEYLWKEADAKRTSHMSQLTWLTNNRFYTHTSLYADQAIFARIGANDPQYNLRRDPVLILREEKAPAGVFINLIESHGSYSPVSELSKNAFSQIKNTQIIYLDDDYLALQIWPKQGGSFRLFMANGSKDKEAKHKVFTEGQSYEWRGPIYKIKQETI